MPFSQYNSHIGSFIRGIKGAKNIAKFFYGRNIQSSTIFNNVINFCSCHIAFDFMFNCLQIYHTFVNIRTSFNLNYANESYLIHFFKINTCTIHTH